MALFPGTYDLFIVESLNEYANEVYTDFNIYAQWGDHGIIDGIALAQDLEITADQSLSFTVPIYTLTGRVTDTAGTALAGIQVDRLREGATALAFGLTLCRDALSLLS